METLEQRFEILQEAKATDNATNTSAFQRFIKDFSDASEEYKSLDMEFVLKLAEYSHSAQFLNTFKNKELKKNLVKRCVFKPILHCIQ